jgi:hypothetical protein
VSGVDYGICEDKKRWLNFNRIMKFKVLKEQGDQKFVEKIAQLLEKISKKRPKHIHQSSI